MKNKIRLFLWKLLGINYYDYLKGQRKEYLHAAKNISIGIKTYHNGAFVWRWNDESSLEIGAYCSIANDVNFILDDGYHLLSEVTSFPLFNHMDNKTLPVGSLTIDEFKRTIHPKKAHIKIGNDVWIGMNAVILPETIIGNGVTIMAGAVISGKIPDYAVVGGVPGKIIRMKHEPTEIDQLNQIAWWSWSVEKVEQNLADFYLPTKEFIGKWL